MTEEERDPEVINSKPQSTLSLPPLPLESELPYSVGRNIRSCTYRIWLYGYCAILSPLIIGCIISVYYFLQLEKMQLFPLNEIHFYWTYIYVSMSLQLGIVCICLFGVCTENVLVLYLFWILSLIVTISDIVFFAISMFWWNRLIGSTGNFLIQRLAAASVTITNSTEALNDSAICSQWYNIQAENLCCGIEGPLDYALTKFACENGSSQEYLPATCCAQRGGCNVKNAFENGCLRLLLQWMNRTKESYLNLPIWLQMCCRLVGLVLLRSEIRRLSTEITARKYGNLDYLQRTFSIDYSPFESTPAGSPLLNS